MATSRTTMPSSIGFTPCCVLALRFPTQALQTIVPEGLLQERLQLGKAFAASLVQAPRSFASFAHKPRCLQHPETL
jgi:hypothetical protein